jgi:uncharacterized protein YodC (DUF2158 family)
MSEPSVPAPEAPAAPDKPRPGDVVQLRSGGPPMTVKSEEYDDVTCEWFEGAQVHGHTFRSAQLVVLGA